MIFTKSSKFLSGKQERDLLSSNQTASLQKVIKSALPLPHLKNW